jgi:metal-responsive CopG/Arc/MetJ family transcriptional regulator
MTRINVRVDERVKKELEDEAREKGVSSSDIVRQVLEEHLKRRPSRESCLDIARRIGLVGIYKDAPSDLSTNPEHMEGFGRD